jgi:ADP-heptose:LPS heptosyltransferase
MVNFKKNRLPDNHIVDRYLQTLEVFDVKNDGEGLDYFINEEFDKPPENILARISGPYIAMAIGAQHFTKRAPAAKLAEILDLIKAPVIILGGKDDVKAASEIIRLSRKNNITDLTGVVSLNNSAWLIRESNLVITHDTGMMHVAAAYKKNVLSIWGNTIPEFGMYPYMAGQNSKIFEVNDLPCRPCTKLGFRDCPKKHFKCMIEQNSVSIAEHANLIFNK